ncbi:MAG TPA: hypothetical protein VHE36_05110 [Sphingomicrobium sp.]|nr:hypothetical protein [Sphingomicrobium sp.]
MLTPILLLIAAQTAAASPPEPSSEIVVQGTRVGKEQIRDFVKSVTKAPFDGQVARFDRPACPSSMGLTPAQNAAVAKRMRNVASAAGIRLAPAPCTPNVFVVVTRDKKAAIEAIDKQFPGYFGDMSSKEIEDLASSSEPAVAWQVKSMLSSDGDLLEKPAGSSTYRVQGTFNPSRIRAVTKPTFVASIVVVDIRAAAGLTTTELADYAVMRTFAATDPDRVVKTGVPTILGVLGQPDDKPIPVTLTYWDLGLLKALYSTDNAYYARYQRGEMEEVVREELERSRNVEKRR